MDEQNKGMSEQWAPSTAGRERGYATDPGYTSGEYTSDRRYGDEPAREHEPDRHTEEIRSDIEQTRAEMSETIDAIQERLRPANVAARAVDSVREAARQKVHEVAHTVQEALPGGRSPGANSTRPRSAAAPSTTGGWPDRSSNGGLMNRLIEHPVTAAVAVGSLAWLAFGGRGARQHHYAPAIYGSTRDGEAFIRETRIDVDTDEMEATDTEQAATGSAARMATNAQAGVQQAMSTARSRARHATERNPLAAVGVAAVFGLAVGLVLPESERENELMGEVRDSMVGRAREAAGDLYQRGESR